MLIRIQQLNNRRNFKRNTIVFSLIAISVALIVLGWIFMSRPSPINGVVIKSEKEGSDWNTYVNVEYGFKIDFPKDWKVYEEFKNTSPIINIYKPQFDKKPPFDYFSDVNAVSIFPQGVETEALIGEIAPFETEIILEDSVDVENITEYILKNGSIWARYINFNSTPESWKPWGSVWSRLEIDNLEFSCSNGDSQIPIERCNPFGGDVFIRSGEVDPSMNEIQKKILETFEFLDEDGQ